MFFCSKKPLFLLLCMLLAGCENGPATPIYDYEVVNYFPHDANAFTQGLLYHNGLLYESTGLETQSSLREVELETGKPLRTISLHPHYFGEGLTLWQNRLIQLTWLNGIGFIYDLETLEKLDVFSYPMQGWGLTHDGRSLIMSDGSDTLYFLSPDDFSIRRSLPVYENGVPITRLNELEYVNGKIFANVWKSNRIACIDPESGTVTAWIDLSEMIADMEPKPDADEQNVLNGIAWDAEHNRLFVTGKRWPQLFEIRLLSLH